MSSNEKSDKVSEKEEKNPPVFKNLNFQHSALLNSKKKVWKNLKQITAYERSCVWPEESVTYTTIDAPPSFKPSKKYSDVSGLPALYVDPHSKLRYNNAEEFEIVRSLPMDIVAGLLELRKAGSIVG